MSSSGELWGVATYFNAGGSLRLRENLGRFSAGVRGQGLKLLIVELALDAAPFEVAEELGDLVVRRRARTLLWQKERLLNIGFAALPASCDAVVWLDADILFDNANWVDETRALLATHVAVQPFASAVWLAADGSEQQAQRGIAATLLEHPNRRRALADHFLHGHPGFAWAMRRDVLAKHGLYDGAILGGGDTIHAHAFYGDTDFWRGRNFYSKELTRPELAAIAEWSARLHADVDARIACVPGRALHLFHGDLARRRYVDRIQILKDHDYDPSRDIALDDAGCWRWNSDKPALHAAVAAYFEQRSAA